MALSSDTLKSDLYSAFTEMQSNEDFAQGISDAFKSFGESGDITTTDTGTVTLGLFTGSGEGSVSLVTDGCYSVILSACKSMQTMTSGGDELLAKAIAQGLQTMTDAGIVMTTVKGEAKNLQTGIVTPLEGTAQGKLTCVSAPVASGLVTLFKSMSGINDGKTDGNEMFAKELSSLVDAYFKSGVVTTAGLTDLSGSIGTGTIA